MRLAGKVAIVTGPGWGIGKAIAIRFAHEGAKVILAGHSERALQTQREIAETGGEALYVQCDVSEATQVEAMVARGVEAFGPVTVLVNNAAYHSKVTMGAVLNTSEQQWDKCLDISLKGAFLCAKYTLPHMITAGGGSIINISSTGGVVGLADYAAYLSAKGGMVQLARSIAVDYAANNVRANVVCPGLIATPIHEEAMQDPEWVRRALESACIKRPGMPEEVANAVLFLASDEASYITGAVLAVDGGYTAK